MSLPCLTYSFSFCWPSSRCWSAVSPKRFAALLALLALAGCGDLPRPFQGQPGATAMRLAQPPPARLAVVTTPDPNLTPEAAGAAYADSLAAGLLALEVPAFTGRVQQGDWKLTAHTELRGKDVVQAFRVQDATGKERGATEGPPMPAAKWVNGDAVTLREAAAADVPAIADLLSRIQGTDMRADPTSLFNRPARVWISPVQGAPGDGNQSLAIQLRRELAKLGPMVQDRQDGADFTVNGFVRATPQAGGVQRIDIRWLVVNSSGREIGNISQGNDIPAGTLNGYWGDVAVVVGKEAAGGVRDVILTQSGRRNSQPADKASGQAPGPVPGQAQGTPVGQTPGQSSEPAGKPRP